MKTVSLLKQIKRNALKWAAVVSIITVAISAGLFALLFFKETERDVLAVSKSVISSYRTDILSGDVRSIELQLSKQFGISPSEVFVFLDAKKQPWVGDLRTRELNICDNANGVCRDFRRGTIAVDFPIYFDSKQTSLWGYLHIEKKPNVHGLVIAYLSAVILFGMLLLAYIIYFQFIRSVQLVSATMEKWAVHLAEDPKNSHVFEQVPFFELKPIAVSLAGLNREITALEKAASDQGSLNTLRSIGHDVLNPVARIKRLLGLLEIQLSKNSPHDPNIIPSLNANLKRLSGYAEQLKSLYKKKTGESNSKTVLTDISAELKSIASEVAQDSEVVNRRIHFQMELSSGCHTLVPSSVIGRIVENLILNSVHASKADATIKVVSFASDEKVHFVIEDEGIGIAKDLSESIFDPGFSTKTNKGTGLGLFVVRQLCEEYHGTVQFSSTLGIGTSFQISFPKAEIAI